MAEHGGCKYGRFWREVAAQGLDEPGPWVLSRTINATHLQHDELKLLIFLS
jgi:hypothetical protein